MEQFLGHTVREILLLLVRAHIHEGQNRYGLVVGKNCLCGRWRRRNFGRHGGWLCRNCCGFGCSNRRLDCWWSKELENKQTNRQGQHPDDDVVEPLARYVSDRLATFDLALALQSLRSHLVDPGEDQCQWEAEDQDRQYQAYPTGRQLQGIEKDIGDLQDQPGSDTIQHRHPDDVAALELFEERHRYGDLGGLRGDLVPSTEILIGEARPL